MRKDYDFSAGVRGKHAGHAKAMARTVVLDSDVVKVFRDSRAVNDALKTLAALVRRTTRRNSR